MTLLTDSGAFSNPKDLQFQTLHTTPNPEAHHMKSSEVTLLTDPGSVRLPCFQYRVAIMRLTSSLSAVRGPMNRGSRKSRVDRYCGHDRGTQHESKC